MASTWAVWHGSDAEMEDLKVATARNCTCPRVEDGALGPACSAHQAMTGQRYMDDLLFARRIVARLQAEEWRTVAKPWQPPSS